MDFATVCGTTLGFWILHHLSARDATFFYWLARDWTKAVADDTVFLDPWEIPASITRLKCHLIILSMSVCYVLSHIWTITKMVAPRAGEDPSQWNFAKMMTPFYHLATEHLILAFFEIIKTVILFLGPIIESFLMHKPLELIPRRHRSNPVLLLEFIIAPLSEEIVFRAVHLKILKRRSKAVQILLSALVFAVGHLPKQFYFFCSDVRYIAQTRKRKELITRETDEEDLWIPQPLVTFEEVSQLQSIGLSDLWPTLIFLFLFGAVASSVYLYIYHGEVVPLTVFHFLCNMFGAPEFYFLEQWKQKKERWKFFVSVVCYATGVTLWSAITYASIMI